MTNSHNNKVPKDLDEIVDSWLDEAKGFTPSDSSLPAEKKTRHISRAEAKQAIAEYTDSKVMEARIEEVERFLVEPGEVIPYNNNTFAAGFRYVVDGLQIRLAELQQPKGGKDD